MTTTQPLWITIVAQLLILLWGALAPALIDYVQTKWKWLTTIPPATEAYLAAVLAGLAVQIGAALGIHLPATFGQYDPATTQSFIAAILAYVSSHLTTVHQKTMAAVQAITPPAPLMNTNKPPQSWVSPTRPVSAPPKSPS